jgi:hypothetical protein
MCQVDPSNEPNRPHISSRYQIFKQHRQKTTRRAPTQKRRNTMQPSIQISLRTLAEPSSPAPVPTSNRVPAAGEALSREGNIPPQHKNEAICKKFRHIAPLRAVQRACLLRGWASLALQFFRTLTFRNAHFDIDQGQTLPM